MQTLDAHLQGLRTEREEAATAFERLQAQARDALVAVGLERCRQPWLLPLLRTWLARLAKTLELQSGEALATVYLLAAGALTDSQLQLLQLRQQGATLAELGAHHQVSKEWIRQCPGQAQVDAVAAFRGPCAERTAHPGRDRDCKPPEPAGPWPRNATGGLPLHLSSPPARPGIDHPGLRPPGRSMALCQATTNASRPGPPAWVPAPCDPRPGCSADPQGLESAVLVGVEGVGTYRSHTNTPALVDLGKFQHHINYLQLVRFTK